MNISILKKEVQVESAGKRPLIFLDETWANAHDGKVGDWVKRDVITGGTLGEVRQYYLCFRY